MFDIFVGDQSGVRFVLIFFRLHFTKTETSELISTLLQFLNKAEYLKGIEVYESIIKAYASYTQHARSDRSKDEL